MTKRAAVMMIVLLPLVASCSSSNSVKTTQGGWSDSAPVGLIPPELEIRQTQGQAYAARHVTGAISVKLAFDIFNPSGEEIVLERLEVQSMGMGAYTVNPTSTPFEKAIGSGKTETVEFYAPANAENTISGANGPVTIRTTAFFNSDFGRFRQIYIKQVNAGRPTTATPR